MQKVELNFVTNSENFVVALGERLSVGRTNFADVAINDVNLSRVHAIFERRANNEIWLFDENSTNGSFVNGETVASSGARVFEGDDILLGNSVRIALKFKREATSENVVAGESDAAQIKLRKNRTQQNQAPQSSANAKLLIVAGASTLIIVIVALAAILVARSFDKSNPAAKNQRQNQPISNDIPATLVDPLKGDPEDIDDLLALFAETQEDDLQEKDIDDVKTTDKDAAATTDLNVTIAFWEAQKLKATAPRNAPVGLDPPGTVVPPELLGDGVIKQKQKLAELIANNYQQPMDFADLAQKRLSKELVELPMATENFYLEVGSSASDDAFSSFSFADGNLLIPPGAPKYKSLLDLAGVFNSSLDDARARKQMRIRLLRMFHPRARPILDELAGAYRQKFNRPLRVTSLTRSMDYQIQLNKVNPNSFKVRGAGSLPPHTSGCAFDLARKHMTAEEQNFTMAKLAEMERRGVLDALREGGVNACFHIFIYPDGKPPKQ